MFSAGQTNYNFPTPFDSLRWSRRIYPEVLVFPRYVYTFVFLVYQESPFSRTSYDISFLFDLSSNIAVSKIFSIMIQIFNFFYYICIIICTIYFVIKDHENLELMWKEIILINFCEITCDVANLSRYVS